MKKIFFVSNNAMSMYNFRLGVISALLNQGYNIVIVAPSDESFGYFIGIGCEVIDVDVSSKGINPFVDVKLLFKLFYLYKKLKPDFIFHYTIKLNIYGSIAAYFSRINSVAVTTGLGYTFIHKNFISGLAKLLYKFAFLFPKEVWFLNKDDLSLFLEKKLVSRDRVRILDGEGIDTSYFHPAVERRKKAKLKYLFIGRVLSDKGIREFVSVAKIIKNKHPGVIFQILGSCDVDNPTAIPMDEFYGWIDSGVIEYLGVVSDVRNAILDADIVVLPSYREGVPRTLMEAASMGKPIIATDVPGCREVVIKNHTGWLVDVKSIDSLEGALLASMNLSYEQRDQMGRNGREYMQERFDVSFVVNIYFSYLKANV